MHRPRVYTFAALLAGLIVLGPSVTGASDTFSARRIDASRGNAVMHSHERILLGLSCRSGPVGTLTGLSGIQLGDTLSLGKHSFRVGVIEVTRYSRDMRFGGQTIARKGDIECVLAASRAMLPYDDDCHALWVRITDCHPLE